MRARRWFRTPLLLSTALVTALSGLVVATSASVPAYAANPVTPGTFTGYGFDQCDAPSQKAMSAWRAHSHYRAAGIYISGNSRACRTQSNLTSTWVANQLRAGWHLMPITLGPQASCSTRFPRYGRSIDPTINPSTASTYYAARLQGKAEAQNAVSAARRLGIVAGSTLFYDLEAFNTRSSTSCTNSALWFLHSWTATLHSYGYASGYYSSAASGMRMLDDQRVRAGNTLAMPDQVWIADWNGKANTSSSYIRSDGWQTYGRAHQYRGGHNETWGGVRINIDSNYLSLRTPRISGSPTTTPTPTPTPSGPVYTGSNLTDRRCTPATINKTAYRRTSAIRNRSLITALQCLLKQQHLYRYSVTGTWNSPTTRALNAFQRRAHYGQHSYVTRNVWTALLAAGTSHTTLRATTRSSDATRVQRALNAAGSPALSITGVYDARTSRAVAAYQRQVHLKATGVVSSSTWSALLAGRL